MKDDIVEMCSTKRLKDGEKNLIKPFKPLQLESVIRILWARRVQTDKEKMNIQIEISKVKTNLF